MPTARALLDADLPVDDGAPGRTAQHGAERPSGSVRVAPMRPSRRVRGLTLLLGLVATLAVAAAAGLSLLPAWSVLAPACVLVGGYLWLRSGVQRELRARRAAQARRARLGEDRAVEIVQAPPAEDTAPATPAAPAVEPVVAEPEPVVAAAPTLLVDEDDIPLTWDPVPVPRPTYAMKAKAERPTPPPAATTPTPEPVVLEDPAAYAEPERRVAGA